MAKITVSKEHVAMYPSLADQLGKTVDASVIQSAKAVKPTEESQSTVTPKVVSAPKKKAAKKRAAKNTA